MKNKSLMQQDSVSKKLPESPTKVSSASSIFFGEKTDGPGPEKGIIGNFNAHDLVEIAEKMRKFEGVLPFYVLKNLKYPLERKFSSSVLSPLPDHIVSVKRENVALTSDYLDLDYFGEKLVVKKMRSKNSLVRQKLLHDILEFEALSNAKSNEKTYDLPLTELYSRYIKYKSDSLHSILPLIRASFEPKRLFEEKMNEEIINEKDSQIFFEEQTLQIVSKIHCLSIAAAIYMELYFEIEDMKYLRKRADVCIEILKTNEFYTNLVFPKFKDPRSKKDLISDEDNRKSSTYFYYTFIKKVYDKNFELTKELHFFEQKIKLIERFGSIGELLSAFQDRYNSTKDIQYLEKGVAIIEQLYFDPEHPEELNQVSDPSLLGDFIEVYYQMYERTNDPKYLLRSGEIYEQTRDCSYYGQIPDAEYLKCLHKAYDLTRDEKYLTFIKEIEQVVEARKHQRRTVF